MEAELVRVERGQAVLRSSNGNEFSINVSKLSESDLAYLKTSVAATSTVTESVAPAAPVVPDKTTNTVVGNLFTFKEAQPLVGGLPESIKLRQPDAAKFMLVQYGPESKDVLYVVFDPPGPQTAADAAYVWSPSLIGFQVPRRITGKPRKMKGANAYVIQIPVTTHFADLGLRGNIELISGVQDWWLYFVVGDFDVVKGGRPSSFKVSEFLNDMTVDIADAQSAKPLRLLSDIVLSASTHPENRITSTQLKMGPYNFVPGKNMINEIKIVIVDENGVKAAGDKMKIDRDNLWSTLLLFDSQKLKQGQKYITQATIDLGPIFGQKTAETTSTMK